MVTKGYGLSVDDIDWSSPADLEPYAKAHDYERKEMDTYIYTAVKNYGVNALMYAIDHCFSGRKASMEFIPRPIFVEIDPKEIIKRNRNREKSEELELRIKQMNERLREQGGVADGESV